MLTRVRRTSMAGFTLIELLLALGILAMMAMLSWRGIDAMVRTQERTQAHDLVQAKLQAGLAQWQTDLEAAQATQRTSVIEFDGQLLRLTRRDGAPQSGASRVVAWSLRAGEMGQSGQWLRWQSAALHTRGEVDQAWLQAQQWGKNPSAQAQTQAVAIARASDWKVFFYRGDAWVNPQSSASDGKAATPEVRQPMPDGVRLILNVSSSEGLSGTIIKDWVRPTWGGGKS